TIDPNGNPDYTEYAIYDSTTGLYLQDDNTLGPNPVWHTYEEWGGEYGTSITELIAVKYHNFQVKARNGDLVETSLSGKREGLPYGFVNEYETECKTYTVEIGDTLEGIAEDQLGNIIEYITLVNLNVERYPSL